MRNPHSTYVYKQALYTFNNFYIPVTEEDLTNFTIVYKGGDTFTTDYLIQGPNRLSDDFKFYQNDEDNEKF